MGPPHRVPSGNLTGLDFVRRTPKNIHVCIHDHKSIKDLNTLHFSSLLQNLPINVKTIRIKQAQRSTIILISTSGKNLGKEHFVTVSFVNRDITSLAHNLTKFIHLVTVQVDEMIF